MATSSSTPSVSIILVASDGWPGTSAALVAAVRAADDLSRECILVDDATSDETAAEARVLAGLRVVRSPSPAGAGRASNLGASVALCDLLVFLDRARPLSQGALSMVANQFQRPDLAACHPVDGGPGCLCVRASCFAAVGGFDEADGDPTTGLLGRLREAGLVIGAIDGAGQLHGVPAQPQGSLAIGPAGDGQGYFEHARPEVVALATPRGCRVLDVGCAAGGVGAGLLVAGATEVVGLEVSAEAVERARARLSAVHQVDLSVAPDLPYPAGHFDRLVCADVLEHLPDPEAALRHLCRWLRPGGKVVLSLPNVRHASVLLPLLVDGSWTYQDEGVLDRTHLRFFSRDGIDRLLAAAGLERIGPFIPHHTAVPPGVTPVAALVGSLGGDAIRFRLEVSALQYLAVARLTQEPRARPSMPLAGAAPAPAPSAPAPTPGHEAPAATASARPAPAVSIVIPVFNKSEYTRQCLEALVATTPGEIFELVVVDNASSDGTAELLRSLEGDVRVISNRENVGFVGACNQGAAVARGEHLLFLNNDTAPQAGWLEALLATMNDDPGVGAAGARLVYPDGRLQEAGGLIFSDGSGWNFGRGDAEPFRDAYNEPAEVDYCSGAALMVRREVFERLGGFDVRYAPAYYEDTDLCFGVRSLGLKVMYCPRSVVVHFEGATAGTSTASGFKRYQVVNKEKFREKWAAALACQEASPAVTGVAPTTQDRRLRRLGKPATASMPSNPSIRPVATEPSSTVTIGAERPAVLVVDPFYPLHDRASGSLRLFRIVERLRALGCHVTFIARNGNGQERYQQELQRMGVEAYGTDPERLAVFGVKTDAPAIDLGRILSVRHYDLAWLSFYFIAEQYLPAVRRHSPTTTIAIDSVDVHFLRESREAELSGSREAAETALSTRARELKIYGEADLVVTVTEDDARILREAGMQRPTLVVPNVHARVGPTPGFDKRRGLVFVGNFAHPPNIDAATWLVREIMPLVNQRFPRTHLAIVGPKPPEEVQLLASKEVRVTGWVEDTAPYVDAARVSVAPLRVGAGMKGKVGEALSRGLPVVGTRMAAEGMGLEHGRHALIAEDPAAFAGEVCRLLQDRPLWENLAAEGRKHVEGRYSVEAVEATLAGLLDRVQARRAGAR